MAFRTRAADEADRWQTDVKQYEQKLALSNAGALQSSTMIPSAAGINAPVNPDVGSGGRIMVGGGVNSDAGLAGNVSLGNGLTLQGASTFNGPGDHPNFTGSNPIAHQNGVSLSVGNNGTTYSGAL